MSDIPIAKISGAFTPEEWPDFEKYVRDELAYDAHLKRAYHVLVLGKTLNHAGKDTDRVTGQSVKYSVQRCYNAAKRHAGESIILARFVALWEGRDPEALGVPIPEGFHPHTVLMSDETDAELRTLDVYLRQGVSRDAIRDAVIHWRGNMWTYQESVRLASGSVFLCFRRRPIIDADKQAEQRAPKPPVDLSHNANGEDAEPLLTVKDIARMLSLQPAEVWKLHKDADHFPAPIQVVGEAPVWTGDQIETWLESRKSS